MIEEIDETVFQHLVELAALELTGEEALYLRQQLNQQLRVVHEMDSMQISSDVKTNPHGIAYTETNSAPIREDVLEPGKKPLDLASIAPQFEDGFIIVPEIPHTKL